MSLRSNTQWATSRPTRACAAAAWRTVTPSTAPRPLQTWSPAPATGTVRILSSGGIDKQGVLNP